MKRKKSFSPQQLQAARQLVHKATGRAQQQWADYLGGKTAHWDRRRKLLFLVITILVLGGMSTLSFFQALQPAPAPATQPAKTEAISPAPLYLPRLAPVTTHDSAVLGRFHQLVDSLRSTPDGRQRLQQYLDKHPGLLDSISYIEKQMQ